MMLTVHRCIKTARPWVQKNGTGNNLEKGGFLLSLLLCDFYQNTEIQYTHTNQHKSAALYLQLQLAPAHLASHLWGRVGEGVSYINRKKRTGEPGGSRKTTRKTVKLEH